MIAVVALAAATGCDGGGSPVPDHQFSATDTTITYAFTDSSVPPEYHRSFVLTIVDGVGTVVVDSYGDETASDEQEVSSAAVEGVIDSYNAGELSGVFNPDLPDDEGCAGGQTFALTLEDATEEASTSIYRCDDASEDAALALAEAASPLLEDFDISALTEDRYRF